MSNAVETTKHLWRVAVVGGVLAAAPPGTGFAQDPAPPPLTLQSQGSFFIDGHDEHSDGITTQPSATISASGTWTRDQMYVQYQIPVDADGHVPIVLIHGCCLTGKTWETTPDGRMGWYEYFARQQHPVYVVDQVGRGRSGFDLTPIAEVKMGSQPPSELPDIFSASHEDAWKIFRFGPQYPDTFPTLQFPIQAQQEFWKQMVPDLNRSLPTPNPTLLDLSQLSIKLKGAVLVSHSESGPFPWQTALISPEGISGIISIEGSCTSVMSGAAALAKIPTLVLFGDFVNQFSNWQTNLQGCQQFVDALKAAGGDAELVQLPDAGMMGNSHMLMQDRNNQQIADFLLKWITDHVEHPVQSSASR